MSCILQPNGELRDPETGALCDWIPTWPNTTIGGGGNTAVIASPSTVWTGTGVYSRTLQSILSGLALFRGQQAIPVATQLQAQQSQGYAVLGGGGAYGNQGNQLAGGKPGTNIAGQFQALLEKHPGSVAIGGALLVALLIGKMGSKKPRGYSSY